MAGMILPLVGKENNTDVCGAASRHCGSGVGAGAGLRRL